MDLNELHPIDRIRLIAHGSLGNEPPEQGNVVSFSKARRERELARWQRKVERTIERDFDDAG